MWIFPGALRSIALDNIILMVLGFNFNIIAVAYSIMAFIIKFSKNITSMYIVMANHPFLFCHLLYTFTFENTVEIC